MVLPVSQQLVELSKSKYYEWPSTIVTWVNNSTTLNLYDIITNKQESFNVKLQIPDEADGIMFLDKLYVMGGRGPLQSTYEIDITKRAMIEKQIMITAKYCQALCTNKGYVFSIGGYDSTYLADCQQYCIGSN